MQEQLMKYSPDPWEGNDFTLLAGGVLVDNGDSSVYGINTVEFWSTHGCGGIEKALFN
jgi:hypothetical protein